MAIYSAVPPPEQQAQPLYAAAQHGTASVDVEAWTISALNSLSISSAASGPGVSLSIPLGTPENARQPPSKAAYKPRKELMRRDSQKRREALLKGKEGSRRRQRWENGRSYPHISLQGQRQKESFTQYSRP